MAVKRQEIFGIQVLRGIAAVLVVAHHALEMSNGSPRRFSPDWLTTSGAVGVDIFFVISGFIMMYSAFPDGRDPIRPLDFLRKRMLRIYPFYWVCLAAMASLFAVGFMKSHEINLAKLVASALLVPYDPLIGVSWTLSYEMLFYFIFASSLLTRSKVLTGTLAIIAICIAIVLGTIFDISFLANPITLEFCFGIVLALFASRMPRSQMLLPVACSALAFAMVAPTFVPSNSTAGLDGWLRVVAWGIPALVLAAATLGLKRPESSPGRFMLFVGDASYSIYLTHVFIMIIYGWLIKSTVVGKIAQAPVVAGVTLVAIAVGALAHLIVERPLTELAKGNRPYGKATSPYRAS